MEGRNEGGEMQMLTRERARYKAAAKEVWDCGANLSLSRPEVTVARMRNARPPKAKAKPASYAARRDAAARREGEQAARDREAALNAPDPYRAAGPVSARKPADGGADIYRNPPDGYAAHDEEINPTDVTPEQRAEERREDEQLMSWISDILSSSVFEGAGLTEDDLLQLDRDLIRRWAETARRAGAAARAARAGDPARDAYAISAVTAAVRDARARGRR